MTTPRTRSQIGRSSRAKGNRFEVAVANAIRPWFPDVRRSRDNGSATTTDTGDLAGTPGAYWSLKDVAAARTDPPGLIGGWLAEATAKCDGAVPLLVVKRAGHTDPLMSWCWLWLDDLLTLGGFTGLQHVPVRMELRHVLDLLAAVGRTAHEEN
jgi:hypothetical protein